MSSILLQLYDRGGELNKMSAFSQNKLSARTEQAAKLAEENGLYYAVDGEMLSYAKQKLPTLPEEQIKEYMEKGYLIWELERAVSIAEEMETTVGNALENFLMDERRGEE